jgi:hypothetical protein
MILLLLITISGLTDHLWTSLTAMRLCVRLQILIYLLTTSETSARLYITDQLLRLCIWFCRLNRAYVCGFSVNALDFRKNYGRRSGFAISKTGPWRPVRQRSERQSRTATTSTRPACITRLKNWREYRVYPQEKIYHRKKWIEECRRAVEVIEQRTSKVNLNPKRNDLNGSNGSFH